MKKNIVLCLVFAVVGCSYEMEEDVVGQSAAITDSELAPNGKGFITRDEHARRQGQPGGEAGKSGQSGTTNAISYHGGPVMLGTMHWYYIWYGNWSGNTAPSILTDLANNIGGSSYWNINTSYYDGANTHISNGVTFGGSTSDNYSAGTQLSDAQVQSVVSRAISSGKLPADESGVYFVLTSADVTATSGFCSQYCGWHTYGTLSGKTIKYAFVGNAQRCLSSCAAQATSPNGNAGADAMASIIAHEAEETATDPKLNAWYDARGYENADKCAWTFGRTQQSGGVSYNVTLGARKYLIQQNWVNQNGGYCALSF